METVTLEIIDEKAKTVIDGLVKDHLVKKLNGDENNNKSQSESKKNKFRELIMNAPTWTDEEYEEFEENRKHIRNSRLNNL